MIKYRMKDGLGAYLQEARVKSSLTQEKLAEILDISLNHLQNIEIDRRKPSYGLLCRIMKTLNISFDDFVFPTKSEDEVETKKIIRMISTLQKNDIEFLITMIESLDKHGK